MLTRELGGLVSQYGSGARPLVASNAGPCVQQKSARSWRVRRRCTCTRRAMRTPQQALWRMLLSPGWRTNARAARRSWRSCFQRTRAGTPRSPRRRSRRTRRSTRPRRCSSTRRCPSPCSRGSRRARCGGRDPRARPACRPQRARHPRVHAPPTPTSSRATGPRSAVRPAPGGRQPALRRCGRPADPRPHRHHPHPASQGGVQQGCWLPG